MWGLFSAQKPSISPPATDYPTKWNAAMDELDALFGKGADIVSAATVNIAAATGGYVHITGNTGPITSLGTPPAAGRKVIVVCDSTPTFTHHGTNLILPGAANFTATAGTVMEFVSESTGWKCTKIVIGDLAPFDRRAPGAIGGTTPAAGSFTTMGASGAATVGGTLGVTGLQTNSAGITFNFGSAAQYARFQFNSSNLPFTINAQGASGDAYIGWNIASQASSDTGLYAISAEASKIRTSNGSGQIEFLTAPAGTAGNPITFTTRLTIANTGLITNPGTFAIAGTVGSISASTGYVGGNTLRGLELVGYGSTYDVTLMNRSGTTALGIGPNSTAVTAAQSITIDGNGGLTVNNYGSGNNSSFISSHATQPLGPLVNYTGAAPNGVGNYFLEGKDTGGTRVQLRSNGGIGNYSANNVNLSDIRTKPEFERYDEDDLEKLESAFVAVDWGRFKYTDQTHDDWNHGPSAQGVERAFASVADELVDIWNPTRRVFAGVKDGVEVWTNVKTAEDKQLKCVYAHDINNIGHAILARAISRVRKLEIEARKNGWTL